MHRFVFPSFCAAVLLALPPSALSTERHFTYTYEVTTTPKGALEVENWVTWTAPKRHSSGAGEFDFRHEFEYGLTDRLQVSLYVADWSILDDATHRRSTRYTDSAVEAIYNLTSPAADFLGSALYGEVRVGDELLELEGKLLLQKNIGPFIAAYNLIVEGAWEGRHFDEREGEFAQSLGISYEIVPQLTVGAELLHEIDLPDWSRAEPSVVWAGPNASFRHANWYATLTPLFQLTDRSDEPDFQTRLILGVQF
ncbi:MAG: hypothetical protein QOD99_241 [Chthoniobacter sp.]|nr:hypothetical protein [Chthoniobacter sp.]